MNEEKMKRVIEAVTQCKPLAKNDWPRGREEWGWLLDRTCDLYSNYISLENEALKKAVKIVVEEFFDFVDKVYPENEEPIPGKEFFDSVDKNYLEDKGYIPDFAEELYEKLVDDDGDEKTKKERDIERTINLMMTIIEFTCHCEEEYLAQMPAEELKAWETLARIDKNYRIKICRGYKFGKIADGFVIDDTVDNLIQLHKNAEEAQESEIAYPFKWYMQK